MENARIIQVKDNGFFAVEGIVGGVSVTLPLEPGADLTSVPQPLRSQIEAAWTDEVIAAFAAALPFPGT